MGSKTLSLRDNRLKNFTTNKSNRMKFINETYKNKKKLCTIYKNCQNFASPVQSTDDVIKSFQIVFC
jgi:hypothetical protein